MAVCTLRTLLFFPILISAYEDQKIITAETGETVTLTCRAPNNNIIIVVEWNRVDLEQEYVLLYRDEQLVPDYQHPSFKNRVDLQDRQMKDGDVSLILKSVTTDDAGTYECRVFMRGTTRRKRAHLKTPPIINITLSVAPPGPTGGTTEDGGKEERRKEDGGKKDGGKEGGGSVGLIVGLSVPAVLFVAAVVAFVIYRKHKQKQDPCHPATELQPVYV